MDAVDEALDRAVDVLAARPSLLMTDIDGTLSRIVARPVEASVSDSARGSLRRLVRLLDAVAVITGREEVIARGMVGVDGIEYVGSYALESHQDLSFALVRPALRQIEPHLLKLPCVALEEKQVSFALHFRNCADPENVRHTLLDLLRPIAVETGTRLMEGKQVIEVTPKGLPSKGRALARLLDEKGVRGAVALGDDLADVDAFMELVRRRESNGAPALCIAVADQETPYEVRDVADLALDGVGEVERFLERLADRLEA